MVTLLGAGSLMEGHVGVHPMLAINEFILVFNKLYD